MDKNRTHDHVDDLKRIQPEEVPEAKIPYEAPRVVVLGSMEALTGSGGWDPSEAYMQVKW